jgi:hypothetical protein
LRDRNERARGSRGERGENGMKEPWKWILRALSWNCINGNCRVIRGGDVWHAVILFFSSFMKEKIKVKVITDECL